MVAPFLSSGRAGDRLSFRPRDPRIALKATAGPGERGSQPWSPAWLPGHPSDLSYDPICLFLAFQPCHTHQGRGRGWPRWSSKRTLRTSPGEPAPSPISQLACCVLFQQEGAQDLVDTEAAKQGGPQAGVPPPGLFFLNLCLLCLVQKAECGDTGRETDLLPTGVFPRCPNHHSWAGLKLGTTS